MKKIALALALVSLVSSDAFGVWGLGKGKGKKTKTDQSQNKGNETALKGDKGASSPASDTASRRTDYSARESNVDDNAGPAESAIDVVKYKDALQLVTSNMKHIKRKGKTKNLYLNHLHTWQLMTLRDQLSVNAQKNCLISGKDYQNIYHFINDICKVRNVEIQNQDYKIEKLPENGSLLHFQINLDEENFPKSDYYQQYIEQERALGRIDPDELYEQTYYEPPSDYESAYSDDDLASQLRNMDDNQPSKNSNTSADPAQKADDTQNAAPEKKENDSKQQKPAAAAAQSKKVESANKSFFQKFLQYKLFIGSAAVALGIIGYKLYDKYYKQREEETQNKKTKKRSKTNQAAVAA